jgi:large subunit ribosomal protein L6
LSRIGKMPIDIPKGVEVKQTGDIVQVRGEKGVLETAVRPEMKIVIDQGVIRIETTHDDRIQNSLHGLTRTLINNMVVGVTKGFEKRLDIIGVGYRAEKKGKALSLLLGFSHPILFLPPEGITIDVPTQTVILVKGIDKHLVGQVAAKLRSFRPPEPYKGKGVRYENEVVKKKAGKATV